MTATLPAAASGPLPGKRPTSRRTFEVVVAVVTLVLVGSSATRSALIEVAVRTS
jgi:hypothetical protein